MSRFHPDMLIKEALLAHPEAAGVFERNGLGCAGCLAADMETLAAVASMHDVSVEALVEELEQLDAERGEDR